MIFVRWILWKKRIRVNFLLQNIKDLYYILLMTNRNLSKEVLYEGVKFLLESDAKHIHLTQQKLYTLYSLAFNYFLYKSGNNPGHYIIRIEDSYLLEKLIRKAKDDTSRKFLQKMALPRKLKYGNSTFHVDFFNFSTWANTNEIPKDKVKGAIIVKNTNKSPIGHDFTDDEEVLETLKILPPNYYLDSLRDFVPNTIVIAYEEIFEGSTPVVFPFIKEEESQKIVKGVSIASGINVDDVDY